MSPAETGDDLPDIAIMIEGQDGLTWDRWKRLARTVEEAGFDGLYRSDHFTNPDGPYKDSLELWTSLTWLADNTDRIEFGPLVTPTSFRHPVWTARMGKEVDTLSDGRLQLGVGAGWQDREHDAFGFDLLSVADRLDRFREGVAVIDALLSDDDPVSFEGEYFALDDARLLPEPARPGGPPLVVGGNGERRVFRVAVDYADEWNGVFLTPADYAEKCAVMDDRLEAAGRSPDDLRRSLMTRVVFGRSEAEVGEQLDGRDREELENRGVIVGTAPEVHEHLEALADAGADRVMLQWLELDDLDRLEALADAL